MLFVRIFNLVEKQR